MQLRGTTYDNAIIKRKEATAKKIRQISKPENQISFAKE
jgi:hypothetical protein